MLYLLLGEGFEEVEALATVDVLRRAGLEVVTVGIGGSIVTGSHGISVTADITDSEVQTEGLSGVILPGGPGTKQLEQAAVTQRLVDYAATQGLWLCAICAAPSILGHKGLLAGRRATCFPGYEKELTGAVVTAEPAVADGRVITGRGMGVSVDFALLIVEKLVSPECAAKLRAGLQCR